MGQKQHGKMLTQEEKIARLEKTVRVGIYIEQKCIFAFLILDKFCELNQIPHEITRAIIQSKMLLLIREGESKVNKAVENGFLSKVQKFTYLELEQQHHLIFDSEIPTPMKSKVFFNVNIVEENFKQVTFSGQIKGIGAFARIFTLDVPTLLRLYHESLSGGPNLSDVYDTDKGVEVRIAPTLVFLYDFYTKMAK